jgi:DNA-binding CsgD family transcriptional regulator
VTRKVGGNARRATVRRLIAASADRQPARDRARHLAGSLTDRETQVLACLGEGLSNPQIAARLYLSEARVKGYVSRMLDKLGCANRAQAGLLAHDARYRQLVARVGEAAGWNSGWVPGRPGCVLRPDVRARRVRRASRARRESAAVAIMSLTRSVTSCCMISGCMGSSWVRRAAGQVVPAAAA